MIIRQCARVMIHTVLLLFPLAGTASSNVFLLPSFENIISKDLLVFSCKEFADSQIDASECLYKAATNVGPHGGTTVYLGPGTYLIASALPRMDQPVIFVGAGWDEHARRGTRFLRKEVGFTPFTFFEAAKSGFKDIAFVDEQRSPDSDSWTPIDFGPWAKWLGGAAYIDSVLLYGVTRFAVFSETNNDAGGRAFIQNLYGQVMEYALDFETSADVSTLNNLHFWPFWSTDEQVSRYQQTHTTPIISRRNDNPMISDVSVYGAKAAMWFDKKDYGTARGVTSKAHLVNVDCDRCLFGPLYVTGDSTTLQGVNITSQSTESPSGRVIPNSTSLKIDANGTEVALLNFRSTYTGSASVDVIGTNNQLSIVNGFFEMWGQTDTKTGPAIQITSHRGNILLLTSCRFNAKGWSSSVVDDRTVGYSH